ncbi:NAD(P)H-dependent oxidoreductase [Paraclostridium ghonii]|uniref:NAD(P)H-dependent oxidoreductase n=1 Tax=Paraclostridium ghonii TaxID=29358 RepID=UPI00202CBFAD|nr:NAD(P)H-dependent oxidoreductase [Paeniclostridium ghonii]MCM0167543.1 NAD(P)H-dependent oxidoreductase [Paeniclostridium ghonii]
MNTTIIVSNPTTNSFSQNIMDNVINGLKKCGKSYNIIDLYEDNFNPVMTKEEVKLYSKGEFDDKLVGKYQKILKETDEIVLIFPIWWNNVPAMLKGFFDKVFIKEFAFIEENNRPKGTLNYINKGTIITTSESDTDYIKNDLGNPIENTIIKATLNVCGIKNVKWINNNLANNNECEKADFLKNIESCFS